jgi:hypothetical protein
MNQGCSDPGPLDTHVAVNRPKSAVNCRNRRRTSPEFRSTVTSRSGKRTNSGNGRNLLILA